MAAHTWWRLRSLYHYTQIGMNEVEMASVPGGANLCVGGTPYTTTTYGGYYGPDKAFNGNYTSGPGEWAGSWPQGSIGYQFAAPVEINEVRLVTFSDPNLMPRLMLFESSDDGSTWNAEWLIRTEAIASYPTLHLCPRPTGGAKRYWGALILRGIGDLSGGSYKDTVIADMELRENIGTADMTVPGGPSYQVPRDGGYASNNAFDNNLGTITYTGTQADNIIFYDFVDPTFVREIVFTATGGSNYNRAPGTGFFVSRDDGVNFYIATAFGPLTYVDSVATTAFDPGGGGEETPRRRVGIIVT